MSEGVRDKIEDFFSRYNIRRYAKGQVLILNGDDPDKIFFIVSGVIKEYDITYRGEEIILNIFKPGAFFPMSFAINGGVSPYTFEAETNIQVRQAPFKDVMDFISENPDVLLDLLSRVYRGTDYLLGRMAELMSGSAKSRLHYELNLEALRFGTTAKDGATLISITEKELGSRAGLSRETVSREIHKLKAEGNIDIDGKSIVIKHPKQSDK